MLIEPRLSLIFGLKILSRELFNTLFCINSDLIQEVKTSEDSRDQHGKTLNGILSSQPNLERKDKCKNINSYLSLVSFMVKYLICNHAETLFSTMVNSFYRCLDNDYFDVFMFVIWIDYI